MARMDAEVKTLLNKTLGSYSDDYRGNVRRIITGTLEECVRRGTIPRHTLAGIELAPRIVTAEQYEQQNKGMVCVPMTRCACSQTASPSSPATTGTAAYPRHPRTGHRPIATAHHGTADQGGPGRAQGRFQDSAPTEPGTCTCAGRPARTARS